MFIVFEYNLLDINKIILLNIKKNLNFYSLDKYELNSSEYFYVDYNNFNSLESVIHVNKQFEYYDNFKEDSLIHFLNIYNLSFFEQINEFKKEIFIKSICEFMASNGVLIKSDVNFLFLFNELRIIWSVLIFYDYLIKISDVIKNKYSSNVKILSFSMNKQYNSHNNMLYNVNYNLDTKYYDPPKDIYHLGQKDITKKIILFLIFSCGSTSKYGSVKSTCIPAI